MRNKDILLNLKTAQYNTLEAIWAPSHAGIQINEMADVTAKEEAKKLVKIQRPLERKIVLTKLKHEVLTNWQWRVDQELTTHQIIEINSRVRSWKIYNIKGSKHLIRLMTGHHFLNSIQSKLNYRTSKNCSCGQVETVHHYLFLCQKYMRYRRRWQQRVVGITEDLEAQNAMSLATAFGQRVDLSDDKNLQLQESICDYIAETKRFT